MNNTNEVTNEVTNETADNYSKEVARCENYRVILCRDDIQWIIQRKHSDRWRSESYCTTKSALIREWTRRVSDAAQRPPEFADLPDSI
jgi:hypothetical protein